MRDARVLAPVEAEILRFSADLIESKDIAVHKNNCYAALQYQQAHLMSAFSKARESSTVNTIVKTRRSSVATKRQPIIMSKREAIKSAATSRMHRRQGGETEVTKETAPEPRGGLYGSNANLRRALADMQHDMNEICGNYGRRRQS